MPQDENHIGNRSMAFAYVELTTLDTQTNIRWEKRGLKEKKRNH
jgi:hypothetical protein